VCVEIRPGNNRGLPERAAARPLILAGLGIAYGGVAKLLIRRRSRARLRHVTAEIVDLHEPIAVHPGHRGRSPVFRFTTEEGHVIDAISAAWIFPEPGVGTRIPGSYDPLDPQRSAERVGVRVFKLILAPLLIALGLGFVLFGLTFL
jgi:hypothetical protein